MIKIMNKVKVSFIGAGNMSEEHIKAMASIDDVSLDGIYSRSIEKSEFLKRKYGIKNLANDIEELYSKSKSDIVVVAVSEINALDVIFKCAKFPWIIFIEKPPGLDISESLELFKLSKSGARIYVGLNRRYLKATIEAKSRLLNDKSPRIISISDSEDIRNFNKSQRVIDNLMYANSIHLMDYISNFARGSL